jgi:hypothetical protein
MIPKGTWRNLQEHFPLLYRVNAMASTIRVFNSGEGGFQGAKIFFQSAFMSTTIHPRLGASARASTSLPLLLGLES